MNTKELDFYENSRKLEKETREKALSYCIEILKEKGATSEESAVSFEEYDDKPCVNSLNCPSTDDVASAEVNRIWVEDNEFVYGNLYYYYEQEHSNRVLLNNDYEIDWLEILNSLLNI